MDNIDAQGSTLSIKNGDLLQTWVQSEKSMKLASVTAKIIELLGLGEPTADIELKIRNVSKYYCLKIKHERMGLLVDIPKPGYGTSNDGNTARRFFSNPELSSEITGVDKELIRNFGIILRMIASGHQINMERFVKLLEDTKNIYLSKYNWYYMPSSVHKLLVHAKDIISFFQLPIGILSEEALEARHKEIRKARLDTVENAPEYLQ